MTPPATTAVIFDLDGVLVDTAQSHLAAWRRIASELGFTFGDRVGESLKGVARETALDLILTAGGVTLSPEDAAAAASRKNGYYTDQLRHLDQASLLPGALASLRWLRENGVPVALGSASRNARTILNSTGIADLFDAVVDGNVVRRAKPDPTVFLVAAEKLGIAPEHCLVLEDAIAGVEAGIRAGCRVVGVGEPDVLTAAEFVVPDLSALDWPTLIGRPE